MGPKRLGVLLLVALCALTLVTAQTSTNSNITDTKMTTGTMSGTAPATLDTTATTDATSDTTTDTSAHTTTPTTPTISSKAPTTSTAPTTSLDDTDRAVETTDTTRTTTPATSTFTNTTTNASATTTKTPTTTTKTPTTTTKTPTTTTKTPISTTKTPTNTANVPTATPATPNAETAADTTEVPPAGEADTTSPSSPDPTSEYGAASGSSSTLIDGNTKSSSSSSTSSWLAPVVVAAMVLLVLLFITCYVRGHKRDDQDDVDRPSDSFFQVPSSNTSNYANIAGTGGNNGMGSAEERAQKNFVMGMRKESAAIAVSAAIPPLSSKMRSDSVTGAPSHSHNRQDSVPIQAEPRFTLLQQVELEQSQQSVRVAGAPLASQAMTSQADQPFKPGTSFDQGQSYDSSYPTSGASAPGVTL